MGDVDNRDHAESVLVLFITFVGVWKIISYHITSRHTVSHSPGPSILLILCALD